MLCYFLPKIANKNIPHGEASPLSLRWQSRTICIRKCSLHPVSRGKLRIRAGLCPSREVRQRRTNPRASHQPVVKYKTKKVPRGSISTIVTMAEPNDLHSQMFTSSRGITNKKDRKNLSFLFGTPTGNRTPDSAVRGLRLNRLTMRARRNKLCLSALLYKQKFLTAPLFLLFRKNFFAIFSRFAKIVSTIF